MKNRTRKVLNLLTVRTVEPVLIVCRIDRACVIYSRTLIGEPYYTVVDFSGTVYVQDSEMTSTVYSTMTMLKNWFCASAL